MRPEPSPPAPPAACGFLLERLVHQVLRDHPRGGRELLAAALDAGAQPVWLLAEILWPAAECLTQLHHDGLIGQRVFNQGSRIIGMLAARLDARRAASGPARQRLLVLAAPGEPGDLGAHLLTMLADACGFTALFGGGGLACEEVAAALWQLEADALVLHGALHLSLPPAAAFIRRLQSADLRPRVQLACVGAMLRHAGAAAPRCDLWSEHPLEILELLALFPDYRADFGGDLAAAPAALHMDANASSQTPADILRDALTQRFPPRSNFN